MFYKLFRSFLCCFLFIGALYSCNNVSDSVVTDSDTASTITSTSDLDNEFKLDQIKLPAGFRINVFAKAPNARGLCWGDKGTLFVGNRNEDKVYAIVDIDKNGVSDKVYIIASGLNTPCGVAFKNGSLYVAEINRILRFDNIEEMLSSPPAYKVVYDKLPTDKHHGWKYISFGPDGKLYVPIGAPCNVCKEDKPLYASIIRMNDDGTDFEIFANGVRNSVGFTWHPQTKELWFTDNGRDMLGDDQPTDELNIASKKGLHFGFPFCHQGDLPDPEFGTGKSCDAYTKPARKLTAHGASLGIQFYTGTMFPDEYRNIAFIAEHGSWNRSTPTGYRIMMVKTENNKPSDYLPFATGWLQNGEAWGRPVDMEVAPDGALLVSDDKAGVIYRISYKK